MFSVCSSMVSLRDVAGEVADLSDLLIMLVKRLAIFPVKEGGHSHNFFLLVDDGQWQDVLEDEACLVHGLFLKGEDTANMDVQMKKRCHEY